MPPTLYQLPVRSVTTITATLKTVTSGTSAVPTPITESIVTNNSANPLLIAVSAAAGMLVLIIILLIVLVILLLATGKRKAKRGEYSQIYY